MTFDCYSPPIDWESGLLTASGSTGGTRPAAGAQPRRSRVTGVRVTDLAALAASHAAELR